MLKILVFFMFWILVLPCMAESVAYTIPVSAQTETAKKEAENKAFEQLLRVLTMSDGNDQFSTMSPEQFLESYRYEETATGLQLSVRFDQTGLVKALQEQGIAVVRDNRPSLLVLTAIQEPNDNWVVGESSQSVYHQGLQEQAQPRGLMLFFPLMDLDDIQTLAFSTVWNDPLERLWPSVQRYHPQGVLVGKVNVDNDGSIHSSWTLDLRNQRYDWDIPAQEPSEMFVILIDNISAVYRNLFTLHAQQDHQTVRLRVDGVHDLTTLNTVIAALKSLEGVSEARTYSVSPQVATFDVTVLGNRQALVDALAMSPHFNAVDDQYYEWRP